MSKVPVAVVVGAAATAIPASRPALTEETAVPVVPEPEAANGLPRFRILFNFNLLVTASLKDISGQRWAGRTDKIFIIMYERMISDGKADAVLRAFVDYDFAKWNQKIMDGMVVYSQ